MSVKFGLPPIIAPDARLLILGSLPGDASLAARRYYAHPANQFWRLLGDAIAEPLVELEYDERLSRLAKRGIGLWDVVESAARRGSLDGAIRAARANPLADFIASHPALVAIAFNGAAAAATGRRALGGQVELELIDLPSSSPANTRPRAEKAAEWSRLAQFVLPSHIRPR